MDLLQLNLLGNLQIRLNGSPLPNFKSRKSQALLSYLVVTGRKHSREWLSTMFWGGLPENKARMNLSQSLTTLRRLFGIHLDTSRRSVSIRPGEAIWTDVGVLEKAVNGDLDTLHQAARLYQGDFLDGVYIPNSPEFEFWTLEKRAHYRDIALLVLDELARYYLQQKPAGLKSAIEFTNQRLKVEPWHEETHRNLMRLYAACGQRSSALKQFDTCRQILLEELDVEPAMETSQLAEKIRTSDPAELANDPNLLAIDVSPYVAPQVIQGISPITPTRLPTFPHHPTEFFGRDQELNALCDLILDQKTRLVTITGLGGNGKTRLAIEFGERCLRQIQDQDPHMKRFEDGIIFVSLEALDTGQSILPAIAGALNFRLDQDDQQIIAYLQSKRLLLILDNFDHLQENAILVTELLTGAQHVQCLVTSQERLGLYGEQVFPLQGLTYPVDSAAGVTDFPAGQLFLRTALRQDPNFTLAESDYVHVVKICQLVDGLPLAIELCATWVTSMPVSSIPAQIQDNLELFSVDAPNLPERHRSLVMVIEGTLQRLPEDQRDLFYHISVFQGGFTLQAASAITGAGHRQLAELINKSLLRYSKSQDRYFLHPLLRQYAQQHSSPRMQDINQQHSHFYCRWFADQTQPAALLAAGQKYVLNAMAAEVENTKKAWLWALRNGDFECLAGLTASIGFYYIWRGGYVEGVRTLRSLIKAIGNAQEKQSAHRSLVMAALNDWLAYFLDIMGDSAQSISLLEESEQFLEAPTLDITQEKAHHLLVYSRVNQSLTREMRNELAVQAIALSRRGNNSLGLPFALFSAARFALLEGNNTLAEQFFAECLEIYTKTGDEIGMTTALTGLGNHAFVQNDYPHAKEYFSSSYDIAEEYNNPERSIVASWFWGTACLFSGQFNRAIQVLDRCAADSKERGLPLYQATALYYLGYAYLHRGDYTRAEGCAQEASPLADQSHYLEAAAHIKILLGAIELARRKFKPALSLFEEARGICDHMEFGRILFGEDCDRFGRSCALISLGETQPARHILYDLLDEAINTHRLDRLMYAFSGLALLNSNLGELECAGYFYLFGGSFPFVRNSRWINQVSREPLRTKLDFSQDSWQRSQAPEDMWDFAREFLSQ